MSENKSKTKNSAEKKGDTAQPAKVRNVFADYVLMLVAPCVMAWYYHGQAAIKTLLAAIVAAVVSDFFASIIFYKKYTVSDLTALYTGAAIALMLPAGVAAHVPVTASLFAVLAVKIPLGGGKKAPFVPAAAGFAFASICFPQEVFTFPSVETSGLAVNGISLAALLDSGSSPNLNTLNMFDVILGNVSGPMGTGCALVLLGCSTYVIFRRQRAIFATLGFVAACAVLALIFPRVQTGAAASVFFELCSGSLLFAAVFFMTDPATAPDKTLLALGYGVLGGVLCMLMRYFGAYEEGVCFAVLLANAAWPVVLTAFNKVMRFFDSHLGARKAKEAE